MSDVPQAATAGTATARARSSRVLGANLGIAATKFVAFVITGSASLLAESVHSVADSGNQVLLLIGRSRARREETEQHQFGFGAERYVYAFIVAVVLFVVGAIFSMYEGISRIRHPEEVLSPVVAFVVLGVAIALEAFSFRTAISESNLSRGRVKWGAFIRRAKAPELPVVLLEDFAALIGLGFALVRRDPVDGDRRRPVGRRRVDRDRRAARLRRRRARRGDEEPADRRVGQPRDAARRSSRRSRERR